MFNEFAEIRVETRVQTDVKVQHNQSDIYVYDKKRKETVFIEVGITSQNQLDIVENVRNTIYLPV